MKKTLIGLLVMLTLTMMITGCSNSIPEMKINTTVLNTPLSIVDPNLMLIPTDIPCEVVQDCTDYALSQDPNTIPKATCEKTCTFITEKNPLIVEVTP